jgi:hypothetical protein
MTPPDTNAGSGATNTEHQSGDEHADAVGRRAPQVGPYTFVMLFGLLTLAGMLITGPLMVARDDVSLAMAVGWPLIVAGVLTLAAGYTAAAENRLKNKFK